jgi:hypothetical protein
MKQRGYCRRELASVVHLLPGAKPVCGSAACLALAYRDSERDESDEYASAAHCLSLGASRVMPAAAGACEVT